MRDFSGLLPILFPGIYPAFIERTSEGSRENKKGGALKICLSEFLDPLALCRALTLVQLIVRPS
jgi:hypothetical protein